MSDEKVRRYDDTTLDLGAAQDGPDMHEIAQHERDLLRCAAEKRAERAEAELAELREALDRLADAHPKHYLTWGDAEDYQSYTVERMCTGNGNYRNAADAVLAWWRDRHGKA
jgi:hypothetical protein